jgi:hypothetical protein
VFSHDLLYLCLSLSSDLFLAIVKYFVDWLHTSLLSSMMILCTNIWVHTYVGGCIRLSPLHVVRRRRDGRSKQETIFQVLYACYINSWLVNGRYIGDLRT